MLLQDLRDAVRTLLANPGCAMTSILCLSLAIGLNSAIFGEDLRQFSLWRFTLFGWMFSAFGAVALLPAAIGVRRPVALSLAAAAGDRRARGAASVTP